MANFDNFIRCSPFSSNSYAGHRYCCNQMNLVSVLNHSFKCQTCLIGRDAPVGVSPIFLANQYANEHIANNHIIIYLICQSRKFQGTWCKDKAFTHISDSIVKATYNTSRQFVCISCLQMLWIK